MTTLVGLVVALQLALSWGPGEPPHPGPDPLGAQDRAHGPRTALEGVATWYPAQGRVGAAGPRLRAFLGPRWRGSTVVVCRTSATAQACVRIRIVDFCACHPTSRLVDLSPSAFRVLGSLSEGVIPVSISRRPAIPATDR